MGNSFLKYIDKKCCNTATEKQHRKGGLKKLKLQLLVAMVWVLLMDFRMHYAECLSIRAKDRLSTRSKVGILNEREKQYGNTAKRRPPQITYEEDESDELSDDLKHELEVDPKLTAAARAFDFGWGALATNGPFVGLCQAATGAVMGYYDGVQFNKDVRGGVDIEKQGPEAPPKIYGGDEQFNTWTTTSYYLIVITGFAAALLVGVALCYMGLKGSSRDSDDSDSD